MSKISPPPIYEPIIADKDGTTALPWILFFNQIYEGDTGTVWTPTFTGLGSTGTPTITGTYYKLTQNLTYFSVVVTPATDTTATSGATYIDNFPLTLRRDGACLAVNTAPSGAIGVCVSANNRIYVPTWTSVTIPVTILGLVEAR